MPLFRGSSEQNNADRRDERDRTTEGLFRVLGTSIPEGEAISLQNMLLAPRISARGSRNLTQPRGMSTSTRTRRATRATGATGTVGMTGNLSPASQAQDGQTRRRAQSNPPPSTNTRGAAAGSGEDDQRTTQPMSNLTQPRTAGRRRPRENVETAMTGRAATREPSVLRFPSFNIEVDALPGSALLEELPGSEGLQLPASFALPILGSRDLTELFSEIFDASRQESRRSRARRADQNTMSIRGEGNAGNRTNMMNTRNTGNAGNANPTTVPNMGDITRELEIENQRVREMIGLRNPTPGAYDVTTDIRNAQNTGPVAYHSGKLARSPPNWFLKPGQTWNGWQHVQHWPPGTSERWSVRVVLDFVNFEKGEVFGTMTASNVPGAENNVVTYFEGEIIDNENSTFYSNPDASARTCLAELRHWSRFPSFRPLRDSVLEEDGRAPALAESGKVFMRWKEKCFLSGGTDCRLTIAGIYYVTLDRVNGDVHAYYWDPNSAPEQKMNLKAGSSHQQGYSLPVHKVA